MIHGKTITAMFTDESEHLWIGTQTGLYHLDGASVHTYSASRRAKFRLPASDIRGISEDSRGNLVVATYGGGLVAWNDHLGGFQSADHSQLTSVDYLTGITRDVYGNFILHSSSKTLIANGTLSDVQDLTTVFSEIPITKSNTLSLALPNGSIIVYSAGQLYLANISLKTSKRIPIDLRAHNISLLKSINDQTAIIGTERGELLTIDPKNWVVISQGTVDANRKVTVTDAVEYRGQFWIASDHGLNTANNLLEITAHYGRENSEIASNHVTTLHKIDTRLMIGTYSGLDQAKPTFFELMTSRNSNVYNDVMAIEEGPSGAIWVGTFDGVFRYDTKTEKHIKLESNSETYLPDERATSIEATSDHIWIGFWKNGIAIVDPHSGETQPFPYEELSDVSVTKILQIDEEDIWIATYDHGIVRVSDKKVFRYPGLEDRSVIALCLSPTGDFYLLTEKSIFLYERESDKFLETEISYPEGFNEIFLLTINADNTQRILLGTKDHGVFELHKKESSELSFIAEPFSSESLLAASSIYGILSDENSNLWLSTSIGIVHLSETGILISKYGETDGLQGNDFSFGAYLRTADGRIFFGGPNGYNIFHPENVSINPTQPQLTIPLIEIVNGEVALYTNIQNRSEIHLRDQSRSIVITLGLLDFANPDQNRYTHILEGLDSGWVDDGTNNKITYANLRPGDYVFRARGANSAGIWSDDGVSLRIQVLPPWWLTWWAYCLYSAILLIAIWGAMRIYREHLLKEEAIKNVGEMLDAADRARDDLQESHELQDNLVRAVHQHNVATLDLVGKYLGPAEVAGESRPKVLGQLKAMELLEKCFYFQGGLLMADVHTYVDSLTNYLLDLTPVDPAKITTINLTTSELLPATIASPAAVILYELLENSLLHAFTDDRAAQFIEIDAKVDRSMHDQRILLLSVSDDGVGLSATQSERSQNKAGLQIVRSLADSMGGAVTVSQNDGSQFHVSLPMP